MSPFVRFIFVVLIVGIVLNLAIVLMANTKSQERHIRETIREREAFHSLLEGMRGRLRRVDIAVEWQKHDAKDQVLQTSLLIRRYLVSDDLDPPALPLTRVVIPGNRMNIDGLLLDFDVLFARDEDELRVLRGMKLAYFAHIYGEGQARDDQFLFIHSPDVPELTRLHPEKKFPTFYEMQLWQRLWEIIPEPAKAARAGVKVSWLEPVARAVRNGRVYTAFLSTEELTLQENTAPGALLDSMLKEAQTLKEGAEDTDPAP